LGYKTKFVIFDGMERKNASPWWGVFFVEKIFSLSQNKHLSTVVACSDKASVIE